MIRKAIGVLLFAVFAMAGVTVHAAPPSWTAPTGTPTVAFVYGDIKVNGVALPRNTSNMLGAFITQVANPIGLGTDWSVALGDGQYPALSIYGDTGSGATRNLDGAKTGDNVTFQLYVASIDSILTSYTMTLNGTVATSYPWYDQSLDNLSINFRYDAPPTWTTAPTDNSVNEGSTLNFSVVASDANSDTVTYTATGLPSYCTLTASTGAVSCAPSYTNAGVDNVCYTASSTGFTGSPLTAQGCATITVVDVNRAPSITAITTKTVSHQIVSAYEIPVLATDPDGNGLTLDATLSSAKAWFSFANNKILIDPSVDNTDVANYTVTVTAIDNGSPALSADNVTFTLSIVNTIYWDNQPVSTKTMAEGETWSFSYKATDPLGGTPVYTVPTLPAFCSNNATTRVVTCSPSYIQAGGPYTMIFRATASGYYASPDNMSVALTVTNTNRPPTVTPSVGTNISGNVGATFSHGVFTASDVDVPAPTLTWSTVNKPTFCSLTGSGTTRTFTCIPTLVSQQGTYDNVQVVVSDGTDNTVRTFSVTVNNRAPVIGAITMKYVSHAKVGASSIPLTLTDLDGNAISFTASISPEKSWATYDNAARTITVTGPIPVADNGAYTVTINATDNGTPTGTATPVTFTLNIVPQIMWDNVIESTYNVDEGGTLTFTSKATDPRGLAITYATPVALPSFCSWNTTSRVVTCNPNYAHAGTYNVSFRASAGNSGEGTVYYALPDNMATSIVVANVNRTPTITPSVSGDWTVYAGLGTPYTRTFAGADLDNEALTFNTSGLPSFCGLSSSGNTRTLSCTPTVANQGATASITVTVADNNAADNSVTFGLTVGNRVPSITQVSTTSVSYLIASAYQIPITATDNDANAITVGATMSPSKSWFSFSNNTVVLTPPIPDTDQDNNYVITVTATDNASSPLSATPMLFTLKIVNQIYWDNAPVSTKSIAEGETWSFSYKAIDPLSSVTLPVYSRSGVQSFCTDNTTTRVITCSPGYTSAGGPFTMSFTATGSGYTALPSPMSVALTVTNTNRPPTVTPSVGTNISGNVGATFSHGVFTASDVDVPAPTLIWSTVNKPTFCSLTGSGTTRTFTCIPTLVSQQGTYDNVQVVVSDGTDNTVRTFSVTVNNRAPVIGAITTRYVSHAKVGASSIPLTLTDLDGNAISFTASISPEKSWATYDNAARTITVTGPIPVADNGAYTVTINATDNGTPTGTATPVTFTLNIVPQIMWDNVIESTYNVDEGGTLTFTAKATDPRGLAITYSTPVALPSFCSWNTTSRVVTCNPNYAHAGTYNVSFRASAGNSGEGTVYYALPDNMATSIVVANVNRTPTITPSVSGDWTVYAGLGTPYTRTFAGADLDNEALTFSTSGLPSFCNLSSTGNTRTLSCTPTVANQGATASITVTVADNNAADNSVTFGLTVGNRVPSITTTGLPSIIEVVSGESASYTLLPGTDNDANALTFTASVNGSPFWFEFNPSTRTMTFSPPVDNSAVDVYDVTITAIDNGTPALSATNVTRIVKIVYPRHFAVPATQSASMSFESDSIKAGGIAVGHFDEIAAYSIHKVPGSVPAKWEKTLVGWGRIEENIGVLPAMFIYGDNATSVDVREGCVAGEEVLFVLYDHSAQKEYFAFDNGWSSGTPLSVTWASGESMADRLNFIEGNRYPIRTGAWNYIGYGALSGYYKTSQPADAIMLGGGSTPIDWTSVSNLADAFPLKSIEGKYDRIISNDNGSARIFDPTLPNQSSMLWLAPGHGYQIKAKDSSNELVWITVPGVSADNTYTLPVQFKGYALLGFWDDSARYHRDGYDDSSELASLRTMVENNGEGSTSTAKSTAGEFWPDTSFDRAILYDAGGAKLYLSSLPSKYNTLKYIAPGYGYWIKVTTDGGTTVKVPNP